MTYPRIDWPLATWEREQEPTIKPMPIAFRCDWCNADIYAYDVYYEAPDGTRICQECRDAVDKFEEKEAEWPEGCEYDG